MAKLTSAQREVIAADLRETFGTSDGSVRKVAARLGVTEYAVRVVMADTGLVNDDARAKVKNAAATTQASNAERRAAIAKSLLRVAEDAISDMYNPSIAFNFGGKDNTYTEKAMDKPPFADRRQLATIAAIALDKHVAIEKHDAELGAGSDFERFQQWLTGAPPHTHDA